MRFMTHRPGVAWVIVAAFAVACQPSGPAASGAAGSPGATANKSTDQVGGPDSASAAKAKTSGFTGAKDSEFDRFLPPDVRGPIIDGLRRVPFDEKGLDAAPSVRFVSAETAFFSFKDRGRRVYVKNRGHLFEQERFDYWVLHQTMEEPGFSNTTRFIIVVDKSVVPRRAFFLQLKDGVVAPNELPSPRGFTTRCFSCHPNGARIVRPQVSDKLPPLTAADKALLKKWNAIIAAYRVTDTWVPEPRRSLTDEQVAALPPSAKPPSDYEVPVREVGEMANAPLVMAGCVGCHRRDSGVRGPLVMQNAESILMMLHYPVDPYHMPKVVEGTDYVHPFDELGSAALTPFEQDCLVQWLSQEQDGGGLRLDGVCRDPKRPSGPPKPPPPPPASARAELVLDASKSQLQVQAATIFAPIKVRNLGISGALTCKAKGAKPSGCGGDLMIDVSVADTGIELRDVHLHRYLKTRQFPFAVLQLSGVGWDKLDGDAPIRVDLEVAGHPAPYDVRVRCERLKGSIKCQLGEVEVRLSRHKLKPYEYLGAIVEDVVKVSGQLVFRDGA